MIGSGAMEGMMSSRATAAMTVFMETGYGTGYRLATIRFAEVMGTTGLLEMMQEMAVPVTMSSTVVLDRIK